MDRFSRTVDAVDAKRPDPWELPGTVLPNETETFHRSDWQAEGCGVTPPAGGIPMYVKEV